MEDDNHSVGCHPRNLIAMGLPPGHLVYLGDGSHYEENILPIQENDIFDMELDMHTGSCVVCVKMR